VPFVAIADGDTLHYRLHYGALWPAGSSILLVHGAAGDSMHWPAELRRLPDHTVYSLDLPGHGRSPGRGRTHIGEYAEIVRGFADALSLWPFVLAGHSMGGAIALEFALRYVDHLKGLVLVGTGAQLQIAPQILAGIREDLRGTVKLLAAWACGDKTDPNVARLYTRRLREADPRVLQDDYTACNAFDRTADVERIAVPTLVICGDADRMTPVKYGQYLAGQIRGARLVLVAGAGHMVMLEQPVQVAAAVKHFMSALVDMR
jgi:pimeloyl-ACP methyl ester carboxylesterase